MLCIAWLKVHRLAVQLRNNITIRLWKPNKFMEYPMGPVRIP
jgi:hypothetical protein